MPTLTGKLEKVKEIPVAGNYILKTFNRLRGLFGGPKMLIDFMIKVGGVKLYKTDWKNEQENQDPRYDIQNLEEYLGKEIEVEYEQKRLTGLRKTIELLHFTNIPRKYFNITNINFLG